MAPQLDIARRVMIKTMLRQGFETKLIASKALCTVRTVQRIDVELQLEVSRRQQSEVQGKLAVWT